MSLPGLRKFRLNDLENQNGRLQSEKQYLYKIAQ